MGMKTAIKATILIVLTGLVSACATHDPLIVDKNWVPKRMVGYISEIEPGYYGTKLTRLIFKNGKEMKADLVELQFIGQLAARDKPPFNIFSGRRCHGCESNLSIYIHSPGDGRLKKKANRYRYPGSVYSHVNGALVEESRAFFGDCLAGRSAGIVVWFVRSRLDRPNWAETVEIVESTGKNLAVSEIGSPVPPIDATLKLVEENRCREIPKRLMSTEP
jgi:hypothetical protein